MNASALSFPQVKLVVVIDKNVKEPPEGDSLHKEQTKMTKNQKTSILFSLSISSFSKLIKNLLIAFISDFILEHRNN